MYALSLQRPFIAQHYLVGGDWGPENQPHSHHYRIEVTLEGKTIDQHGYLVDLEHLQTLLDDLLSSYRDRLLNDLPEFNGLNPSVEHFARILCAHVADRLRAPNIERVSVRLWEDTFAWASFSQSIHE